MSVNDLPPEILLKIFRHLCPLCLPSCSNVCKRWGDVIDNFYYRKLCKNAYLYSYEEAYRKANISWRELYKSLSLWRHIESAKINCYHSEDLDHKLMVRDKSSAHKGQRQFFVLQNGIISYPQFIPPEDSQRGSCYRNTVFYYDSTTLVVIEKTNFGIKFDQYAENDDFIVFRSEGLQLYIMSKANKKLFLIGDAKKCEFGDISKFEIVKNKVYFIDKHNMIGFSHLDEQDGEICVKTEALDVLNVGHYISIIAMCYINENQTNILTSRGDVYSIINKKIEYEGHIAKDEECINRFQIVANLRKYGFDWSQQAVYDWVDQQRCDFMLDLVRLSKLNNAVVKKHGDIVVMGTSRRNIHVYYRPYRCDGALKLYNAQPNLKVNLNEYYPLARNQKYTKIEQIDVIEIVNGHRIVVLYSDKIVIIEFIHGETSKRVASVTRGGVSKRCRT